MKYANMKNTYIKKKLTLLARAYDCHNKNLPEKEIEKRFKKLRKACRTLHYHTNSVSTKCPICIANNIVLHKRVNQRKFQFHCYDCDFTYMLVIKPHEILCLSCNGAGVKRTLITPAFGKKYFHAMKCDTCMGNGKLDWCSRVTRAKGMR